MKPTEEIDLDAVRRLMPPQTRLALDTLSRIRHQSAEDVLRDEIRAYMAGKLPAIDIDAIMREVQQGARQAGFLIGRLRRWARERDESAR